MSEWKQKRFWKEATVEAAEGGFTILLDGRSVKTPAKSALIVPTQAMALAIAEEWQAQDGQIDPASMPVTKSANAAIDKVAQQHGEVADMLAAYGETDLLCYRATSPQELIDRQARIWQPVLDWAGQALDAPLTPASGVMHIDQPEDSLGRLSVLVHALDNYELAAFHDLVSISGSLILGFATIREHLPAQGLWDISRLDEKWQEEQWGEDDEALDLAATKRSAFLHAARFFRLAR